MLRESKYSHHGLKVSGKGFNPKLMVRSLNRWFKMKTSNQLQIKRGAGNSSPQCTRPCDGSGDEALFRSRGNC